MASDGFLTSWLNRFSIMWAERRHARQQEEDLIREIDREIEDIGEEVESPQGHLTHVTQALTNIRRHLQMQNVTLRLNQTGIKVDATAKEPFDEITLTECAFTGSSRRVAVWVGINANEGSLA